MNTFKRRMNFTIYLAAYVVFLFCLAMAMTYFSEYLVKIGFFGDVRLDRPINDFFDKSDYDKWGARHYWYWWMCFILFLISILRIFMWAEWYWSEKNNEK